MRHIIWVLAAGLALSGCVSHHVTVDPVEVTVNPIHLTMDINLKVDRELEDFFDFEEEAEPEPPVTPDGGER